jgi:ligand-binding sensor domain-containing protein/anti-sigma regulatory factor (Ser/Thr protein kinase)
VSLEQGLSDVRVLSIVQDRYGYMWFGTANGLNRYDGYTIRVYLEGERGLPGNTVKALFRRKNGDLWVGTNKGAVVYDYVRDSFLRPFDNRLFEDTSAEGTVNVFAEDISGRLYLGCNKALFRFDGRWVENYGKIHGYPSMSIVAGLRFRPDHHLWVTTLNRGFYRIDIRNDSVKQIIYKTEFGEGPELSMHEVEIVDERNLLIGIHSYGLALLDTGSLKFSTVPGFLGKSDSIRYNAVMSIYRDHKNRYWIGTVYHGLVQYIPHTNQLISYRNDVFNKYSYGEYYINCLYEDREHNIWIGTNRNGAFHFNPNYNNSWLIPPLSAAFGSAFPGREVLSVCLMDSTTAWLGTDKGAAFCDFGKETIVPFKGIGDYERNSVGINVNYTFRDKDGILWFAPRALGLVRYDPRTGKYVNFHRDDSSRRPLLEDFISNIIQQPDGNLLLLIQQRLSVFHTKTFEAYDHRTDSTHPLFRLKQVRDFYLEHDTSLIIGTDAKGFRLYRYSYVTRRLSRIATPDSTKGVYLNAITPMPDGSIACAASNGIHIVEKDGRIRKHYLSNEPFFRNKVQGLITGIPGYIWFCTDRNIGRVELSTGNVIWLGETNGIGANRFFGKAFRLLPDGRMVIGSASGFYLIDASDIHSERSPAPYLVGFKVFNEPYVFDRPIQDVRVVHLSHKENFFSFELSSLNYRLSNDIEYAYKLEGLDRDWQYKGKERTGIYTNVPGGDYRLRIKARSASGEWTVSSQAVRIIIDKPFWETWWFRIITAALIGGLIYSVYRYRVSEIKKQARLRSDYEIRLNELEISALRTQMNPHFIFNCLNTINSYINSNQRSQANQYITRFAKLIRMILENSRQRKIPLSGEIEALGLYIQLEQLRFGQKFDYHLVVAEELDTDNIEVPPLIIQPFAENAILHGLLPLPSGGKLNISVTKEDNMLCYLIEDNGIGREAARKRSMDGALRRQSHGMDITVKRITLFNRENGTDREIQITDKHDAAGNPVGTVVKVFLAYVEGF